jgi:hypothetical protein
MSGYRRGFALIAGFIGLSDTARNYTLQFTITHTHTHTHTIIHIRIFTLASEKRLSFMKLND